MNDHESSSYWQIINKCRFTQEAEKAIFGPADQLTEFYRNLTDSDKDWLKSMEIGWTEIIRS